MTILPMHVLQRTYNVIHIHGHIRDNKEIYVCSLFGTYFWNKGSKSTAHRYIKYPGTIPCTLIYHYADPANPYYPSALYRDIYALLVDTYLLTGREYMKLWDELTDMCNSLPEEDKHLVLTDQDKHMYSLVRLVTLFTRVLWYTVCQEYAQARLQEVA